MSVKLFCGTVLCVLFDVYEYVPPEQNPNRVLNNIHEHLINSIIVSNSTFIFDLFI